MIAIKLTGGLGNQMFQYACAAALAERTGSEVVMDKSGFYNQPKEDTPREYDLDIFNLEQEFLPKRIKQIPDTYPEFKKVTWEFLGYKVLRGFTERHYNFDKNVLGLENVFLNGFFQSEKYFIDQQEIIRRAFKFKNNPSEKNAELISQMESTESVSIHVRRGDYVSNANAKKFHGLTGVPYYNRAIELINERVSNPVFYIFSDDPQWCRENIIAGSSARYIDHNVGKNSFEDMRLMSFCNHNIIANSSFSWWGAWLNENPDKYVVAPKQWFQDNSIDTSDVIPDKWQKI